VIGKTAAVDPSGDGLQDQVGDRAVPIGAVLAEGADADDGHARITSDQPVEVEHARPERFDDHIGLYHRRRHGFTRAQVAPQPVPAKWIPARRLHLHHRRAQISQQPGGVSDRHTGAEFGHS
jgi:hypothetical protein